MERQSTRRALVSVSDKSGLEPLIRGLVELDFEILSTGGTRRCIEEFGVPVTDISTYTGFPEIMDGRVKTLHPKVHGGLLGRPTLDTDQSAMQDHDIEPFEVVVCNLYPFEETVGREGTTFPEAIEQIDIGGPSMVRSSAKNHAFVAIVTNPDQYLEVLEKLQSGSLDEAYRRQLAAAAFAMTAKYDAAIADYFAQQSGRTQDSTGQSDTDTRSDSFPQHLHLEFERRDTLRYGENPHQRAAFYVEASPAAGSLASANQIHGKELSYNNLLDLDAAWSIVQGFEDPACAIIKHNNPCGCGTASRTVEAFRRAYSGDPVSAFGSIVSFNRMVDGETAHALCEPGRFIESIIAPGFEPDALETLTTIPTWKKNVRLMVCEVKPDAGVQIELRRVSGGLLVQDRDHQQQSESEWQVVTKRNPTDAEFADLRFAWQVCKHVKSNAIVFARDGAVTGVGAGQMSRLDSATIAARKSESRCQGGACASDAFFPFRDGVDQAAAAGIVSIIQPGGSKRDDEVIQACDEHGIAMVFTGRRHFRH